MPDPREAIFDVLKAKWERARDERERQKKGSEAQRAWDEYQKENQVAAANYRNRGRL